MVFPDPLSRSLVLEPHVEPGGRPSDLLGHRAGELRHSDRVVRRATESQPLRVPERRGREELAVVLPVLAWREVLSRFSELALVATRSFPAQTRCMVPTPQGDLSCPSHTGPRSRRLSRANPRYSSCRSA